MNIIKGNIVDVVSSRIFKGEIHYHNGVITSIIEKEVQEDQYILPGLINAHVHIESTMLSPLEYSKEAVKHGTVAAVCDPHEIANVLGVYGVDYMIENGKSSPFKFFFGAPSCVPATPFETSGFELNAEVIKSLLKSNEIHFLAEMMNYPGVVYNDKEVMEKVNAGIWYKKPIDGHAPGLKGADLKKYAEAGITTDHECVNMEEATAKLNAGIKVQIREGSAAKNLEALYKLIDLHPGKIMLCTDDSHPDDLINGHINIIVKRCLELGCDFFNTLKAATIVPKIHYNLNVGLLQKGDCADFIIIDNPKNFNILSTYINGEIVSDNGIVNFPKSKKVIINNFEREELNLSDLQIKTSNKTFPVMEILDGELITKKIDIEINKDDSGNVLSDPDNDVLKIVVASRYDNSPPSVGFVKNMNLKRGALASSIAHDSHNIIAVGTNDNDLLLTINKLIQNQGGIIAYDGEFSELRLEIAGLMTNDSAHNVARRYEIVHNKAKQMGSTLHAPFMTLSFLSLLVIPEIKISDKGIFDVNKFEFIKL